MCNIHTHSTRNLDTLSDPTRTITLRSRFAGGFRKRFREFRGLIRKAIIEQDVFAISSGMGGNPGLQNQELSTYQGSVPGPEAFDFPRIQGKISAFMEWLQKQEDRVILEVGNRQRIGESIEQTWQNVFIEDSYKRGVQRASFEMGRQQFPNFSSIETRGGIAAVMSSPFHVDRMGVVFTRAFNELKGITDAMDQQISRILAQGLADGDGPRLLARKLNSTISGKGLGDLGIRDSLGRFIPAQRRAEILARTEVIRAHHQGMFQEYKNFRVQGVNVQAEFRTAGARNVCL